jgi:SEC-C motif
MHHEPEIGRNDPCPCGSGKKYKKCHGASIPPRDGGDEMGVPANRPNAPKKGSGFATAPLDTESE